MDKIKKYKKDVIKGTEKMFYDIYFIIGNRKKFWFEVDTNDSYK